MLNDGSVEIEGTALKPTSANLSWRDVDGALRGIARQRSAFDASEAHWLREAERLKIWRECGMVSALDYMERILGYAPRTAQDRLRVARALADLPALTTALACDDLKFTAVRELCRVATSTTEEAWRDAALGKNLRQVEELVAGHRPGDGPGDPPDPEVGTQVVRYELSRATIALARQARSTLDDEHGQHLDDDRFFAALCTAVLDNAGTAEPTGRARFQIAITVCDRCDQGWQDGAGAKIAIDAGTVERARCDAQHIGSLDATTPERAEQDVPPAVVRLVWRRDHGRCQTPGCRSARGLEIHHVVRRVDGGSHDPRNLTLRCSACHANIHAGILTLTGEAPDKLELHRRGEPHVQRRHGSPASGSVVRTHVGASKLEPTEAPDAIAERTHVGASKLDMAVIRAQAKDALVGLGWKPAIAHAAIDEACVHLTTPTLEMLIREALRRCPKPMARTS